MPPKKEGEQHQRLYRRRFALGTAESAAPQNFSTCLVTSADVASEARPASRLITAAAWARAAPATVLAPLSHMLMNGFFLSRDSSFDVVAVGVMCLEYASA